MKTVSRNIGRCVTETKREDFDQALDTFGEFVRVSQFAKQPKHVSEVGHDGQLSANTQLGIGTILYGVEQDGSLTWLGQIIDSSD